MPLASAFAALCRVASAQLAPTSPPRRPACLSFGANRTDAACRYRFHRLRQPKIEHLDRAIVADLDVGRFQIAMDDALLVSGFEGFSDLLGNGQRFVDWDWTLSNPISKRRTLHVREPATSPSVSLSP
jgi:hypothetical protein